MTIRKATTDDAAAILEIYSPFCMLEQTASFELAPPTLEEMCDRITTTLRTHPWIVYEREGRVIGYASASKYNVRAAYDWSATVSIYLHESARGMGVGKQLYAALFKALRSLGYFNAYALITVPNAASVQLHKSMGFVEVGLTPKVGYKAGRWLDVSLMWLALNEHVENPEVPRAFSDLAQQIL